MKKLAVTLLTTGIVFSALSINAQTLFTFGNTDVSKDEFLKVYNKNANNQKVDYSKNAISEYIDLYALFRMKVKEAEAMRLDTLSNIQNELSNYKQQLAKSYLSDKEVNEQLTKEAYARLSEEIDVDHILIFAAPNADSTSQKAKIDSIYQQLVAKKATFEDMARKFSEDRGTQANGGKMGFITALQTVYPFEIASYNTPVGSISKPFRTQYGYHIVKVNNRRKSSGEVQVQQILLKAPKSQADIDKNKATVAIIKEALKKGTSFDDLVQQYSEDRYSKNNKGILDAFKPGTHVSKFEDVAFAMKNVGDVSEYVETEFGWHILKLIKKTPLQSYDAIKSALSKQVELDDRSNAAKSVYEQKVKVKYQFKENPAAMNAIIAAIQSNKEIASDFKPDAFKDLSATLFELKGKSYTQQDFVKYASELTRGKILGNTPDVVVKDLYNMYQQKILTDMQIEELYTSNMEYRSLLNEYKDGTLLFDITEKNVWLKADKDSVGLNNYFEKNRNKYQWQPMFNGNVYQSGSKELLEMLRVKIAGGLTPDQAFDEVVASPEYTTQIFLEKGKFEMNKFKTGTESFVVNKPSPVFLNKDVYTLVVPQEVRQQASNKSLEEARGFVVADYQNYLEHEWNASLKKKYPLNVNDKVLNTLVK